MELLEFTERLWKHINVAIRLKAITGTKHIEPDVILISFERIKEMRIAIGMMLVSYDPSHDMLKFRGIRILPDPTKGNDDFEILYNVET